MNESYFPIRFAKRKTTNHILVYNTLLADRAEMDVQHRQIGFLCIGVHYVIRRDGTLEIGRPLDVIGAHCKGNENATSIAIAVVGFPGTFTDAQRSTLTSLVANIKHDYPSVDVKGITI